MNTLQKKVGPLPIWAWGLIVAGIAGYLIVARRNAAAQDQQTAAQDQPSAQIDPTTGQPFSGLPDSGVAAGGSSPGITAQQEIEDIGGLLGALQGLGLAGTGGGTAGLSPIMVPPGSTLYDPNTGVSVTAPGASPAAGAGSPKGHPGQTRSLLDRARARVAAGRGGTGTDRTLRKAGYTQAQINHARKTKTPLGQPHKVSKPKRDQHPHNKPSPHRAAPTHPLQHRTAAPPTHAPSRPPRRRHR